jgi:hypothetical protein
VPLVRADTSRPALHALAQEHDALDLPSLVLYKRDATLKYQGVHTAEAIIEYVRKQLASTPVTKLRSVADVESFLNREEPGLRRLGMGPVPDYSTMVVGVFSDVDMEEDEMEEFREAARALQGKEDVYTGMVTDPAVAHHFKRVAKLVDRTPAVVAQTARMSGPASINLDELYGEGLSIVSWVFRATVPLVGEMSGKTFGAYQELGLPMLIMFLNLSDKGKPGQAVPGVSGGIANEQLIREFEAIAADHVSPMMHLRSRRLID